MVHLSSCPLCNATEISAFLTTNDHFLTSESFNICRCGSCGLLFTNPRPDEHEINRYYKSEAYISHSDSGKGMVNRLYQLVRNKTLNQKARWIRSHVSQGRLLDIGAGTGHFLETMKKKGFSVTGVEVDESARNFAENKLGQKLFADIGDVPAGTQKFDVITLWHVLEHVYDFHPTLDRIRSLLNADGLLVIAVPNPESYDAALYRQYWAAWDVPRHLYHFTRKTITEGLDKHHFIQIGEKPMKFDSYYVSMLSEKYRSGKNRFLRSVMNGWLSNIQARMKGNNYSSLTYFFKTKN